MRRLGSRHHPGVFDSWNHGIAPAARSAVACLRNPLNPVLDEILGGAEAAVVPFLGRLCASTGGVTLPRHSAPLASHE
jgi:hypothetical protein